MKKFVEPDFDITLLTVLDVITESGNTEWEGSEGENGTPWH